MEAARSAGLRYVLDDRPGIRRLRSGKGFRYVGPDGTFGLCYCWFYYDERDKVLDAEWQYHTD